MHLILCGHKASGKTTLAHAYAQAFNYACLDTDALILSTQTKRATIPELYQALGDASFRALEATCIQAITLSQNTIIATGGGSVLDANTTAHLKSLGPMVYLDAPENIRNTRLKTLHSVINVETNHRDALYHRIADYVLDATHQNITQLITNLHHYRCHHGE